MSDEIPSDRYSVKCAYCHHMNLEGQLLCAICGNRLVPSLQPAVDAAKNNDQRKLHQEVDSIVDWMTGEMTAQGEERWGKKRAWTGDAHGKNWQVVVGVGKPSEEGTQVIRVIAEMLTEADANRIIADHNAARDAGRLREALLSQCKYHTMASSSKLSEDGRLHHFAEGYWTVCELKPESRAALGEDKDVT